MKRLVTFLSLLAVIILTACGGGGGDGDAVPPDPTGGGSSLIGAGFTGAVANPGANTVSMSRRSVSGNMVTVNVNVTDTNDVYGASFDVTYDSSFADYVSWTGGTLLEEGGHSPYYNVYEATPGRIVVVASRSGSVPAVDVTGTTVLIRLTFRVNSTGASAVGFENAHLSNASVPPDNLIGITWEGGDLTGT